MRDSSDMELVRDYARRNSESAFAELVQRHVSLVYSVALRHTGNTAQAEEIAQAVFVILARKAGSLGDNTVLAAWLYETARLTALSFLRAERRRQFREQEAYMQSTLDEPSNDSLWRQMAPVLDDAMQRLEHKEREAVVLRFFKDQTLRGTAGELGISEAAAQKRVDRALEKLHRYFGRRGISSTTAIIAGEVATRSVQMAPAGLAHSVTALALAKGATASASTGIIIKGGLNLMAWTKAKTAVGIGVGLILLSATATITFTEISSHRTRAWQFDVAGGAPLFDRTPLQVTIVPAIKNRPNQGSLSLDYRVAGWGLSARALILRAYEVTEARVQISSNIVWPPGLYDFMANIPQGAREALQIEAQKKFGMTAHREMREKDALMLRIKTPAINGLKPYTDGDMGSSSSSGTFTMKGTEVAFFCHFLEGRFQLPVVDGTGLPDGRYNLNFHWPADADDDGFKQQLLNQLGVELVRTNIPAEIVVLEKAR